MSCTLLRKDARRLEGGSRTEQHDASHHDHQGWVCFASSSLLAVQAPVGKEPQATLPLVIITRISRPSYRTNNNNCSPLHHHDHGLVRLGPGRRTGRGQRMAGQSPQPSTRLLSLLSLDFQSPFIHPCTQLTTPPPIPAQTTTGRRRCLPVSACTPPAGWRWAGRPGT
jgi:hypothetical protein